MQKTVLLMIVFGLYIGAAHCQVQPLIFSSGSCHREALLRDKNNNITQTQDLGVIKRNVTFQRTNTSFTLYDSTTSDLERFKILDKDETAQEYEYLVMDLKSKENFILSIDKKNLHLVMERYNARLTFLIQ